MATDEFEPAAHVEEVAAQAFTPLQPNAPTVATVAGFVAFALPTDENNFTANTRCLRGLPGCNVNAPTIAAVATAEKNANVSAVPVC